MINKSKNGTQTPTTMPTIDPVLRPELSFEVSNYTVELILLGESGLLLLLLLIKFTGFKQIE